MEAFQFYLQLKKQKKVTVDLVRRVGCTGDDSQVVFGQKIPDEVTVGQCVMEQPVLLSPKFGVKSSHSHHKTSQKYTELTAWPAKTNCL
jgi:hypothetical protein